jgi:predicted TIM-barrel fold metal-dependent hydrolase
MKSLRLFDAHACIGRPATPFFGSWLDADGLVREMDEFGIERSLVYHVDSREISTALGNETVARSTARHDQRLVPVWALQPYVEDLGRTGAEQVSAAVAAGVGAARIDPWPTAGFRNAAVAARDLSLELTVVATLCQQLEAAGMPLILDIGQANWNETYELCRAFPRLPVIVLNVSYKDQRNLYAGLESYKNLHFEISSYHAHRGLEDLDEAFGSAQVLFGSRVPDFTPASAVSMVVYADIPRCQAGDCRRQPRAAAGAIAVPRGGASANYAFDIRTSRIERPLLPSALSGGVRFRPG